MKLLIVYHAGLAEDAKSIFREYAKQGVELTVIVPAEKYTTGDSEKTFRYVPVPFGRGFKFFPLFSAIKKAQPDVIHVFDEYSSLYLAKTIICRTMLYGGKVPVFAYAFQNIPFKQFFVKPLLKICFPIIFLINKHANGVTGSNTEALAQVKKHNPKVSTKLIFWGVDLKIFENTGVPRNANLVGYVGRLVKEKDLDTLLRAVQEMKHCRVALVGSGDQERKLKALTESLNMQDRVHFLTNVPRSELKHHYSAFGVFVLPSKTIPEWKEQYGRVLVEAMASGLPIVGSSSGAISEVLEGYPRALIFKEGDSGDLAKKIEEVKNLSFPKNFDLDSFLQKFSVENFAREHIEFYKNYVH